jgi:tRNA nucleotidyltransferase (CCA-adding enzyme)
VTILETIKAEVLPLILPTEEENQKLASIYGTLKQSLEKIAKKLNIKPSFIQNHGSTGVKQTHLRGTSDLDIFVGLDPSDYLLLINLPLKKRKKDLEDLFLTYVKNWFIPAADAAGFKHYQVSYAEHPYLIISHGEYEIDVVGCFNLDYDYILSKGPVTAVDRTPWHSKLVAEKLSHHQKQDVRLLKAFFKANHIYGDKATLGRFGFTGFSAEILIYFFKSIEKVFSNFEKLQTTPLDFFNRPAEVVRKSKRFVDDYLIIIDPVDKNRNLASSISKRAYEYAVFQISHFLAAPAPEFFIKTPITLPEPNILKRFAPHLVVVEFRNEGDIHYTEIRDRLYSTCEKVRKLLEKESTGENRFGMTFFEVYFEGQIFAAVFYCTFPFIEPSYLRKGPPESKSMNTQQFCKAHPDAFLREGFYYASMKREFQRPLPLIAQFFQGFKQIEGLELNQISQDGTSEVGKRTTALMLSCILPLYGVISP